MKFSWMLLALMVMSVSQAATENKKVPLKYVMEYFPPADQYVKVYPDFFLTKPERLKVDRDRLALFMKAYGLGERPKAEKKQTKKKSGKGTRKSVPVKPKRWVWGFYFEKNNRIPLINVNGQFMSLSSLFHRRNAKVLRVRDDVMLVSVSGRVYKIEVGKPLPF